MAAYIKYDTFVESLCNKLIDCFGTSGSTADVFKAIIHTDNTAVSSTAHSSCTQIPGVNGYTTGGNDIAFVAARSSGTVEADGTDVTWTASGGALGGVATGQYFSIYDSTAAGTNLMCKFDYGSTFNVATGETMTLDFGTTFWQLA